MSGNSLEHVFNKMKQINVTLGWGALAVYASDCLNDLLAQHYQERLSTFRALPLFDATIDHDLCGRTRLEAIEFGVPTLSFAGATTQDNRIQATLPILSGTYRGESSSADDKLHYFVINESMGFALEIDLQLDMVVHADRRVLMLDLRKATGVRCNMGLPGAADERLAAALGQWLHELPDYASQFALVNVARQGDEPWMPTDVRVYTQAAPATAAQGEGALLMFFRVKGRARDGVAPTARFPYLVVNERGAKPYPVTVVLDRALDHLPGSLLPHLSYHPQPIAFSEKARLQPFDTALFGRLEGALFKVDAPLFTIGAGQAHQFILRDFQGQAVAATSWSIKGLGGGGAGDYGSLDGGRYQATSVEKLKSTGQVFVVTGDLYRDDVVYSGSTRARVGVEQFELQPEVAVRAPAAATELHAFGVEVEQPWRLLGEQHGELEPRDGTQATFTPNAVVNKKALTVQQIGLDGNHLRRCSVVMPNGPQLLSIQPEVFRKVVYHESLQLPEQDASFLPDVKRRWTLFGEGTLSEDGRFTAPSSGAPGFSVVTCEIEHRGVVLATGYNVLQVGRA